MGRDVRELGRRGGGEILVAAGEDIPALAASTSAFGTHTPFLSVDIKGC